MSYLSELLHRQISIKDALAKSIRFIKEKTGLTVSDAAVDKAVKATDELTDGIQKLVNAYIATHVPILPAAVIATSVATAVLNHIDVAIAGAGNVIKDNN